MILKILGALVLIFLLIALALIIFNACKRIEWSNWFIEPQSSKYKVVDYYLTDLNDLNNIPIGSTVLIDQGWKSFHTGIYVIRNNSEPLKINTPDFDEQYFILKGEFANHIHTIRKPNYEIRHWIQEVNIRDKNDIILNSKTSILIIKQTNYENQIVLCDHFENNNQEPRRLEVLNISLNIVHLYDYTIQPNSAHVFFIIDGTKIIKAL